jgi:hypothetical protein
MKMLSIICAFALVLGMMAGPAFSQDSDCDGSLTRWATAVKHQMAWITEPALQAVWEIPV